MQKDFKQYLTPPVLLVVFLLIISLMIIFPVLDMIILGAILAYGIKPVACKIESGIKYSSISIIFAMILVLIPIILLFAYIIGVSIGFLSDAVMSTGLSFNIDQINAYLPNNYTISQSTIEYYITKISNFALNYLVNFVGKLPNVTLDLFILVCSVFYFVRDGDNCYDFIKSFVPEDTLNFFDNTIESVKNVLKSIFYGHFLTSVIIGIFGCIGYSLLGYPYGIFLGVLTGILQLIPVFGPWPIYWALAIIDMINGNYIRVIIVLLFGFFLSSVDMYIRPALSSHYADIHPLILLIGFLAGPLVYGIVGFILGPLVLGITYAILDSFKSNLESNKNGA